MVAPVQRTVVLNRATRDERSPAPSRGIDVDGRARRETTGGDRVNLTGNTRIGGTQLEGALSFDFPDSNTSDPHTVTTNG